VSVSDDEVERSIGKKCDLDGLLSSLYRDLAAARKDRDHYRTALALALQRVIAETGRALASGSGGSPEHRAVLMNLNVQARLAHSLIE
jgi:hypothetical protein